MEKIFKKIVRFFGVATIAVGLAFTNVQSTEAAITLVDPDEQTVVVSESRTQSRLETLAPTNESPRLEVLDSGSSNSGLENLASASNVEVLDAGALDNSFEVSTIYTSDRTTGVKMAYKLSSYRDYQVMLNKLDTGTVLILTNPVQVSNINKWTSEVGNEYSEKGKGLVVSFSEVPALSPGEIDKFTKAGVNLSNVKFLEIRKEYKNSVVKYNDGRSGFDRTIETINNVVSTWNMIDNLSN